MPMFGNLGQTILAFCPSDLGYGLLCSRKPTFPRFRLSDAAWDQFSSPEAGAAAGLVYLDVFCSQVAFCLLLPLRWRGRFVGWGQVNPVDKEAAAG